MPTRVAFLTDGISRTVQIGNQTIQLRQTTPRNMATAGRTSGLVIQALRHLGKEQVDDRAVEVLRKRLTPEDKACRRQDLPLAPIWISKIMRALSEG